MMNILLYIAIISAIFITSGTAPLLGITQIVSTAFMPMTVYIICRLLTVHRNICKLPYNKVAIVLILFALFIIAVKYSISQDFFKTVLQFLLIPMFISISFEELTPNNIKVLKRIILIFFITECSIAIYERIFSTHLFAPQELENFSNFYDRDEWSFRSTSLLGHPLANAMCVTTILSFILTNKTLDIKFKLFYFALGYVALFSFNARGATIVATLFMIPYILYLIRKTRNKKLKRLSYFLLIVGAISFIHTIINTPLGGRLLNQEELLDESAQTRMEVFSFYQYIRLDELLLGAPDLYSYLMRKLGAGGVENGVIVLIINYGLVIIAFLLPMLVYFHYTKLSVYNKIDRLWIMGIFYIIGTMNPNLSMPVQWTIWLFAYYAFRNRTFKNIYHENRYRGQYRQGYGNRLPGQPVG